MTKNQGNLVPARILFVRDRNRSKKWLALLSTDLELTDEEVIQIYGKRWDKEGFFKTSKSFLNLAKEFQGRSYDCMLAFQLILTMLKNILRKYLTITDGALQDLINDFISSLPAFLKGRLQLSSCAS